MEKTAILPFLINHPTTSIPVYLQKPAIIMNGNTKNVVKSVNEDTQTSVWLNASNILQINLDAPYSNAICTISLSIDFDRHLSRIRQALLFFISETSRRFLSIHAESIDATEEALLISLLKSY